MSNQANDKELLLRLREGDHRAFEKLYKTYANLLAYKLHRLIKIDSVVEELHQDVFLRFWNAKGQISENTNLKAYLFAIARNLVIDFYRKAAKDKALERQLVIDLQSSYDHIEPLLNRKETHDVLEQLISLLPPQRQKVFRMIKVDGKSYEEAAHHFGVSISTVKDHMAKSSQSLRQQLAKNYPHVTFVIAVTAVFG